MLGDLGAVLAVVALAGLLCVWPSAPFAPEDVKAGTVIVPPIEAKMIKKSLARVSRRFKPSIGGGRLVATFSFSGSVAEAVEALTTIGFNAGASQSCAAHATEMASMNCARVRGQ